MGKRSLKSEESVKKNRLCGIWPRTPKWNRNEEKIARVEEKEEEHWFFMRNKINLTVANRAWPLSCQSTLHPPNFEDLSCSTLSAVAFSWAPVQLFQIRSVKPMPYPSYFHSRPISFSMPFGLIYSHELSNFYSVFFQFCYHAKF